MKPLIPFPEDDKPGVNYEGLITPVRESFKSAFEVRQRNRHKVEDVSYEGYTYTPRTLAMHLDPRTELTAEVQRLRRDDGRDLLDLFFNIIFILGYEQGARRERGGKV